MGHFPHFQTPSTEKSIHPTFLMVICLDVWYNLVKTYIKILGKSRASADCQKVPDMRARAFILRVNSGSFARACIKRVNSDLFSHARKTKYGYFSGFLPYIIENSVTHAF